MKNEQTTSATPAAGPCMLRTFVAAAETQAHGRTCKPERFTQSILEITPIRKVDLLGIVGEDHEGRRRNIGLRDIEELQPLSRLAGWRMGGDRFFEHLIERRGWNAL